MTVAHWHAPPSHERLMDCTAAGDVEECLSQNAYLNYGTSLCQSLRCARASTSPAAVDCTAAGDVEECLSQNAYLNYGTSLCQSQRLSLVFFSTFETIKRTPNSESVMQRNGVPMFFQVRLCKQH
jgi:hypothetical protein